LYAFISPWTPMVANAASGLSQWPLPKRPTAPSTDCEVSTFAVDDSSSTLRIPKANVPRVKNVRVAVAAMVVAAAAVATSAVVAVVAVVLLAAATALRLRLLHNAVPSMIVDAVVHTMAKVLQVLLVLVLVLVAADVATRTGIRALAPMTIGTSDHSPSAGW
jgi:hypothetical protein